MNEGTTIRIMLVSDDQIMCDGLSALFGHDSTVSVVGEANDEPQALERVRDLKPDLVVTDLASWAGGGIATVRSIINASPETKVVIISAFYSKVFITQALAGGASGYVVKKNGFNELSQAVRTVSSGAAFLCSAARSIVLGDYGVGSTQDKDQDKSLTDRENTILQLLAEGRTSKQIAFMLEISSKTVDACRRRLMKKLNVESLADLVKCAIVMGLTTVVPTKTSRIPTSPVGSV